MMIIVGIAVIVSLWAMLLILNFDGSKAEFAIFKDHSDRFEAIKNNTLSLASDGRFTEDTFIFENGGNVSQDRFHTDVDIQLQNNINELVALSNGEFTFLRYAHYAGEHVLRFVFNWERAHGGHTYHFVYCASEEVIRSIYNLDMSSYELYKLGDAWYGIMMR